MKLMQNDARVRVFGSFQSNRYYVTKLDKLRRA